MHMICRIHGLKTTRNVWQRKGDGRGGEGRERKRGVARLSFTYEYITVSNTKINT